MTTKEAVLAELEKHRGRSISGEKIAGQLNISRNAVWKAINSLRDDGYIIDAVNNSGYALSNSIDNNILSAAGMLPYLSDENCASKIHIYKSLESTNKTAKEMAVGGCEHGTVIIADSQTAGRGRYGRNFYSPPGSGLYISIILRPGFLNLTNMTMITAAAAVAVCKAIQTVTGKDPLIKWVNDILLNDKKICGILTEGVTDFESGTIGWIVVGIGINITTDNFPNEIKEVASSLFFTLDGSPIRNRLAAEIINDLLSSNSWITDEGIYSEYKKRLAFLGSAVTVIESEKKYEAAALDIDEQCRLIVKKPDGSLATLSSGEVSIKRLST